MVVKMKKNSGLIRGGVLLLALTLVTSCFVGGTFAKYATEASGKDLARVAKWGVVVDVVGNGFRETYGKNSGEDGPDNTVVSGGAETVTFQLGSGRSENVEISNVLAPGTRGTFGGIQISGTPEVAVKVETTAAVELTGWNVGEDGEFYCPLEFTIGDETISGLDYTSATFGGKNSFETKIKSAIEKATLAVYPAGTNLEEAESNKVVYQWKWPFENGAGITTGGKQSDLLDTLLGNNAASGDPAKIPAVRITVTTRVTQID